MTKDENDKAAREGWFIGYVYDLRTLRWALQVLPMQFAKPFANAYDVLAHVIRQAKTGDALALKALQLVMASHNTKTRKKK